MGTLIALTFLLTLEDVHRFRKSRDVDCYLGLQPGRRVGAERAQMHISRRRSVSATAAGARKRTTSCVRLERTAIYSAGV